MDSPPPGFKEEFEVVDTEPRNWKGICISLLVIGSICALISGAILLLSPHLNGVDKLEKVTLEDVLFGRFPNNGSNATWISDNEIIYRDLDGTIFLYDIETDWRTVLASNFSLARFQVEKYTLSADKKFFLLVHDITSRRTYSSTGKYKIYDTKNSFISSVNTTPGFEVQFATWGPRGSQLLTVSGNNLFYTSRLGVPAIQLTTSGREGLVYNGIPDLINEEFVLKRESAIWWLKTGEKVAFASYDNSYVEQMPIAVYGPIPESADLEDVYGPPDDGYPRVENFPYPKPGRRIAITSLWVSDLTNPSPKSAKQVTPPREILSQDFYLLDVTWVNEATLSVLWSRRTHNKTVLSLCSEEHGWTCEKLLDEHLPTPKGWLSITEAPIFAEDYYFMKLPVADGAAGSFDQVAMIYFEGNKRYWLTHGQNVVTKLLYYRPDLHTLYFVATVMGNPGVRHVYSVVDMEADTDKRKKQDCLSCSLGPGCQFNDATFSPSGQHFILECLGPGTPRTELRYTTNNTLVQVLNTNPSLEEWLAKKLIPRVKHIEVPLPGGAARVQLLLPESVSESDASHHFPLIIELDSRPEGQSVNLATRLTWGSYLASKREWAHAQIDVRGSAFQGDKWKHKIYHHLGEYETEDIIEVVRYLKDNLQYIDGDKIALYGKGVGGYLSMSLVSRSNYFNCGIAVAPITSWRNYAAPFVEKFMGLPHPSDNYINYDKTDLPRNLEMLKDKQLLLIHGTADRLANIQHSMLLIKCLTDKGVPFRLQIYPDGDHSLYRERVHFHHVMEDFFASCFKIEDDEDERLAELPLTKVLKGSKRILGGGDD